MTVTADEFRVEDTLGILALPGVAPTHSSAGLGWTRMYLSGQQEKPYHQEFAGTGSHLLILHLDGPATVTRGCGGQARTKTIGPGGLFLHPAGRDLNVRLSDPLRTIHLYLDSAFVDGVCDQRTELSEEIGSVDPLLEQLMLSLDVVVRRPEAGNRLYADSLAAAVAAQLATRHTARAAVSPTRSAGAGLSNRAFAAVTELMEAHLDRNLSLAELAASVQLSESQFARAFKVRAQQPPHRYLLGLRLQHAERLLRSSALSIAEVAAAAGFAHQEHLTRVMRARLGTTPGALRAHLV